TQKDICTLWGMRKQTVNTALSKLLGSGLIELSESDTDKRSKIITLTQLGSDFSEREVQRVIDLEMRALRRMTADEREAMLSTSKRFLELMRLESAADTGGF
ncbi:MAG: MarR family transcriptional regulator, partial [Clostridia bacterium]